MFSFVLLFNFIKKPFNYKLFIFDWINASESLELICKKIENEY